MQTISTFFIWVIFFQYKWLWIFYTSSCCFFQLVLPWKYVYMKYSQRKIFKFCWENMTPDPLVVELIEVIHQMNRFSLPSADNKNITCINRVHDTPVSCMTLPLSCHGNYSEMGRLLRICPQTSLGLGTIWESEIRQTEIAQRNLETLSK